MTYTTLKAIINDSYAAFCAKYVIKETLGIDNPYSNRQVFFVKCIYKVLMNQVGDETLDGLTKIDIQNNIRLFDKYSNSKIQIEYT
jgi:hypothetical protein